MNPSVHFTSKLKNHFWTFNYLMFFRFSRFHRRPFCLNGDIFISIVAFSLIQFIFLFSLFTIFCIFIVFRFFSSPNVPYFSTPSNNLDTKPEIKNHYRGHKLSMWLSLIPQIHSPGDSPDLSMRHHHFIEENPQFYDGKRIFSIILPSKWNWKSRFCHSPNRKNSFTELSTSECHKNQCTINNSDSQT